MAADVLLALRGQPNAELRSLRRRDAAALLVAVTTERPRLERWLHWPRRIVDLASAESVIDDYDRKVDGRYAALGVFNGDQLLGGCNLVRWLPEQAQIELGVWAITDAEGRGLMRSAAEATIRYARQTLRVERLEWRAAVANQRSHALARRLGFVKEGVARASDLINGHRIDMVCYSLVQSELDSF
jgi:ribosomal-protein-serine acetyltransferase